MMKKLLVLAFLILPLPSFALEDICPSMYELTGGIRKFASRATGENLIYTKMLEHALEKQAEKQFGGEVKIKIDSFSAPDLKEGKFRSVTATGENVHFQSLDVNKIELKSICGFNQIKKDVNAYNFITDFPANVRIELSAENLNKITETTDYKKTLNQLNSRLLGFLEITGLSFDIQDDKLIYNINYLTPFTSRVKPVKIKTDIAYKNGDTEVLNGQADNNKSILRYLLLNNALNYINPLDFSAKILENGTIETEINQIHIADGKVIIDAVTNIRK